MEKKTIMDTTGEGEETEDIRKKAETEIEEKAKIEDPKDAETELLIIEYQKNASPDSETLKILDFWEGEEWREDEGEYMRKCIQRLVEEELVQQYQQNSRPDAETTDILESCGGAA